MNNLRILLRYEIAVVGLGFAISLLIPIAFIGDPGSNSSGFLRGAFVFGCLAISLIGGSLAAGSFLSMFVNSRAAARNFIASGSAISGVAVSIFVAMAYLLYNRTVGVALPLIILLSIYAGGGMILSGAIAGRNMI